MYRLHFDGKIKLGIYLFFLRLRRWGKVNRIRKKLASERGASITFALLLFLVCAVLSSVIIVAATAASGRLSRLADMDRRYYNVTSAAGLLKDVLDGKSITVEHTKTTQTTRTANNPSMSGAVAGEPQTVSDITTYTLEGGAAPIVIDAAVQAEGDPAELSDYGSFIMTRIAHQYAETSDEGEAGKTFPLTGNYTLEAGEDENLTCDVYTTMNADGTVVFEVRNNIDVAAPKDKDQYILRITFKADVVPVTGSKKTKGATERTATGYQAIDTQENATETKVTLRLIDISTI